MANEKFFTGTVYELVQKMLKEYIEEKDFRVLQISYVPSEDLTVKGPISAQLSGYTLILSFSGKEDRQLENTKIFSDEYMNGFYDRKLRRGQVYQLTLISAYKNSGSDVKVSYPLLSGKWAQWESYWANNVPEADCVVYAAVNLLSGETAFGQAAQTQSGGIIYQSDFVIDGENYQRYKSIVGDNAIFGVSRYSGDKQTDLTVSLPIHIYVEEDGFAPIFNNLPITINESPPYNSDSEFLNLVIMYAADIIDLAVIPLSTELPLSLVHQGYFITFTPEIAGYGARCMYKVVTDGWASADVDALEAQWLSMNDGITGVKLIYNKRYVSPDTIAIFNEGVCENGGA